MAAVTSCPRRPANSSNIGCSRQSSVRMCGAREPTPYSRVRFPVVHSSLHHPTSPFLKPPSHLMVALHNYLQGAPVTNSGLRPWPGRQPTSWKADPSCDVPTLPSSTCDVAYPLGNHNKRTKPIQ
ncbi:hypothetical protein EVAR_54333_1 [Eumeta japonica]|uniref:Uncharacterized protein n=1 Tax=Eumeta variegata TaxID=151549 RepID=A0A4C1Y8D5_EUMVA|nr:hypothetical protein EVAR_54333_1 [Eumeta japonica]